MATTELNALARLAAMATLAISLSFAVPAAGKDPGGVDGSGEGRIGLPFNINGLPQTDSAVGEESRPARHLVAQAAAESSIINLGPAEVDVYWFTATLIDGKVTLDGYVPDEATLNRLGSSNVDASALELADGETRRFASAVEFGLDLLGQMSEGRFSIRDNIITIKGRAKSADDLATLEEALEEGGPQGLVLALSEVRLPLADPFTFRAEKVPDGTITLSGHVPDTDAKARLAAVVPVVDETELADGAPDGFASAALGGLAVLREVSAGTLDFDGTSWHLEGTAVRPMEALAAERAFAAAGLDPAQWAYNVRLPTAVPPAEIPAIADYVWSAEKLPAGTIAIAGHVPTAALKSILAVRAGDQSVDSTEVGSGAPEGFALKALAAIDALLLLDEGSVTFADGQWTLSGESEDGAVLDAVTAALGEGAPAFVLDVAVPQPEPVDTAASASPEPTAERTAAETAIETALASPADGDTPDRTEAAPTGLEADRAAPATESAASDVSGPEAAAAPDRTVAVEPLPAEPEPAPLAETVPSAKPEEPAPVEVAALPAPAPTPTAHGDFIFESSRRNAGPLFLSGVVPADATRRYFAVIAGNVPTGGLSISTTLPPDFIPSADAGLRALTELFNGELGYDGARWYLTGTADTPDRRTAALNGIMALPNAAAWTTDIGLTPPSDLCGRTVATFTSSHSILFQSGSARMTEDSAASLAELATSLSECPETPIWVEGHTDADGPDDLNLALSVSRAEAVVEALTTLGVDAGRLYAVGYGESLPIASNDTSDGKRANRRIVFSVVEE